MVTASPPQLLYVRLDTKPEASPEHRALDGRYVLQADLLVALQYLSASPKKQAGYFVDDGEFIPWTDPAVLLILASQGWVVDGTNVTLAGRAMLRNVLRR